MIIATSTFSFAVFSFVVSFSKHCSINLAVAVSDFMVGHPNREGLVAIRIDMMTISTTSP